MYSKTPYLSGLIREARGTRTREEFMGSLELKDDEGVPLGLQHLTRWERQGVRNRWVPIVIDALNLGAAVALAELARCLGTTDRETADFLVMMLDEEKGPVIRKVAAGHLNCSEADVSLWAELACS